MNRFAAPTLQSNPNPDDWDYFYRQFENYLTIVESTDAQKLPLFINSLGRDGVLLYDGLPEPKATFTDAIARFQDHFKKRTSILLKRKLFYEARQGIQETVTNFAVRLRRLSRECDFGPSAATLMRDIFVVGIRDDRLGERLLAEDAATLTFDIALSRAEAFERARLERGAVSSAETNSLQRRDHVAQTPQVNAVNRQRDSAKPNASKPPKQRQGIRCFRCDGPHKANDSQCPARDKYCNECKIKGHLAKCCNQRKTLNKVHCVEKEVIPGNYKSDSDDSCTNRYDLFYVNSFNSPTDFEALSRDILVQGIPVRALIDTGSQINVLPSNVVPSELLRKSSAKIFAYSGSPLSVLGETFVKLQYKSKVINAKFFVVDSEIARPLMSFNLCRELGLMQELAEQNVTQVAMIDTTLGSDHSLDQEIRTEFHDLFNGIGTLSTGDEYTITLSKDAVPYSPPARRLPPAIVPAVKLELDRMVSDNIIRPIEEPTPFCSPMLVAYRKNGDVRIVSDLRKLNEAVCREEFQIPTIEELAIKATGSKVFSKCDLKSGFWQVPIAKDSEKYLAFSTPVGRFCYQKLPMGLTSAPEFFSRVLNKVLEGIESVLIYVDDIVVCTDTVEKHKEVLCTVLQRLRNAGLKLNPDKCSFFKNEIDFMGHTWTAEGVQNSPDKIKALKQMTPPSDKQSLRSFLGLASYVGQSSIAHFSSQIEPLWAMLKDKDFQWSETNLKHFYNIRELLCSDTARPFYDPHKPVVVQTDACGQGLGGVLLQDDRPVVFVSRTLTETEKRYSQIEREFLAIAFCLNKLRQYLIGVNFRLMIDNKPIVQLFSKPIDRLSNRLQRWMLAIQHFSFSLAFIKNTDNILADALSRNAITDQPSDIELAEYTLCMLLSSSPIDLKSVAEQTTLDSTLSKVVKAVQQGWNSPESKALKPYFQQRHEIAVKFSKNIPILCLGSRIIIPTSLRNDLLETAHETHVGMTKMKAILRAYSYWPGMTADIENFVRNCVPCTVYQKRSDIAPLTPVAEKETKPWASIAIDLTGPSDVLDGKVLLTIIDLYSRYPECFILRSGTSLEIINKLRSVFARQGFPERIISDNGTPFVSKEFTDFLSLCGIESVHSSLYYPQGNSTVERLHNTIKSKLKRIRYDQAVPLQKVLDNIMFNIRSFPHDVTGQTPYFRLYGREMSSKLSKLSLTSGNNATCRKRNIPVEYGKKWTISREYKDGQQVFVRKGKGEPYKYVGVIIRKIGNGTYECEVEGRVCRFNQSHLKPRVSKTDQYDLENALKAYDSVVSKPIGNDVVNAPNDDVRPFTEVTSPPTLRRSTRSRHLPDRFIYA